MHKYGCNWCFFLYDYETFEMFNGNTFNFGLGSTIGARYLAKVYDIGLPTWKQMDMKITKEKNKV